MWQARSLCLKRNPVFAEQLFLLLHIYGVFLDLLLLHVQLVLPANG